MNDQHYKQLLTSEQYWVTREKGTERPFSGIYWETKTQGTYHCICCDEPLFSSQTKFESGTGWPSFWEPLSEQKISSKTDRSLGMDRTEVECSKCQAHLGHVFPDGPPPTGLRFCLNSASLSLKPSNP